MENRNTSTASNTASASTVCRAPLRFKKYAMTEIDNAAREKIKAYHRVVAAKLKATHSDTTISEDEMFALAVEDDSLCHLFYDGCGDQYIAMAQEAARRGFRTVIDIGANTGYQYLHFDAYGIAFVGVDSCPAKCVIPPPVPMLQVVYPTPLTDILVYDKDTTLGISSLCMGWLGNIDGMLQQASKDFRQVLCTMPETSVPLAEQYFSVEHLEDNLYWLSSKRDAT